MRKSFVTRITFIILAAALIAFDVRTIARAQEVAAAVVAAQSSPVVVQAATAEKANALPLFTDASTNKFHIDDASFHHAQSGGGSGTAGGGLNNSPAVALTAGEKFHYGWRQAFYTPGTYIAPAISAGYRRFQEADAPSKTGSDKFADYLSDYARLFGTLSTTEIFGSGIYPILFKQNPKYISLKETSQGSASGSARFLYAIGRTFVTNGDNGKRQPNYSRFAGDFTGAAIANVWERNTPSKRDRFGSPTEINRRRGVAPTFSRFGFALGFDALSNVLEEFFGFGR